MLDKSNTEQVSDSSIGAALVVRMWMCDRVNENVVRRDVLAGLVAGDDEDVLPRVEFVLDEMLDHPDAPLDSAVGGGSVVLSGATTRSDVEEFVRRFDVDNVVDWFLDE